MTQEKLEALKRKEKEEVRFLIAVELLKMGIEKR